MTRRLPPTDTPPEVEFGGISEAQASEAKRVLSERDRLFGGPSAAAGGIVPPESDALAADDACPRFTTVHSRYHVLGYTEHGGELAEHAQRRSDAFRIARAHLGPRGYDRVEVYDNMARRGEPELWGVDADSTTVLERRK